MAALHDMSYRELLFQLCQVEDAIRQLRNPQHPSSARAARSDDESALQVAGTLAAYELRIMKEFRRRRRAPVPDAVLKV
jgi:hypothetical protein